MRFLYILKKVAKILQFKQNTLFTYDIEKQKKYISTFSEPVDDIERSYFQYKCQMKLMGIIMTFLLNLFSFFMTFIYLFKIKNYFNRENPKGSVDAVFLSNDISHNVLPLVLQNKYPNIKYANNEDFLTLDSEDKKFIFNLIKRYPLSWYFVFKCLLKIAMYSARIKKDNPKVVIVYAEYSFTSSVLTNYCDLKNIKHINIMHGEKLFYIRDSFFHFHECHVWDEYYKNLFIQLRAYPKQFIISVPKSLKFEGNYITRKLYDYTYYLAGEQKNELIVIANSIKKLANKGYKISIRPHPRYTDLGLVNILFENYNIEKPTISIEESILRTTNAISLYSTVLNQAYNNGINIVIDDISNPKRYKKLFELQYMFIYKKHRLLSEEVNNYEDIKNNN